MKRTRTLASSFALAFATSALAAASFLACNTGDLSLGEQGKDAGTDTGPGPHPTPAPTPDGGDAGTCPAFAPPGDIGACTDEGLDCTFDINHGCAHCFCTAGQWLCSASCVEPVPDAGDAGGTCNNGPSELPAQLACGPHVPGCDAGAVCDAGSGPPPTWTDALTACGQGESVLSGACGGYLAIRAPRGPDGEFVYLYNATTKAYVATLEGANDQFWGCDGPAIVSIDTTQCFHPDQFGFCAFGQAWTPCGATDAGQAD